MGACAEMMFRGSGHGNLVGVIHCLVDDPKPIPRPRPDEPGGLIEPRSLELSISCGPTTRCDPARDAVKYLSAPSLSRRKR